MFFYETRNASARVEDFGIKTISNSILRQYLCGGQVTITKPDLINSNEPNYSATIQIQDFNWTPLSNKHFVFEKLTAFAN